MCPLLESKHYKISKFSASDRISSTKLLYMMTGFYSTQFAKSNASILNHYADVLTCTNHPLPLTSSQQLKFCYMIHTGLLLSREADPVNTSECTTNFLSDINANVVLYISLLAANPMSRLHLKIGIMGETAIYFK